jgi:hypothetical protein
MARNRCTCPLPRPSPRALQARDRPRSASSRTRRAPKPVPGGSGPRRTKLRDTETDRCAAGRHAEPRHAQPRSPPHCADGDPARSRRWSAPQVPGTERRQRPNRSAASELPSTYSKLYPIARIGAASRVTRRVTRRHQPLRLRSSATNTKQSAITRARTPARCQRRRFPASRTLAVSTKSPVPRTPVPQEPPRFSAHASTITGLPAQRRR